MCNFVTTLIFTFVCFNAYVYGESHFVCKQMEEVSLSHKGDSGRILPSRMGIAKQSIKGQKGEKQMIDYSAINATVKSYISEEISSVEENNIRMIEKKFENLTAQIENLILKNTEQEQQIAEHSRKTAKQERKIAKQARKNVEQDRKIAEQEWKIAEQDRKIAEQAGKDVELTRSTHRPTTSTIDYDGKIRLVNGTSIKNGRIEVFHNGIWGTVCGFGWSGTIGKYNAGVTCRQLGFRISTWYEVNRPSFIYILYKDDESSTKRYGAGTGKIWLGDVRCTGSENALRDCSHSGWGAGNFCSHSKDTAVECE